MQQLQWGQPHELRPRLMQTVHLSGDAVQVMPQGCQEARHDLPATVQRWPFARDKPGGVLRNAASGESTLTQIHQVVRNV